MKIAYFSYELPPDLPKGGIGTYQLQIAEGMAAAGHTVFIFSASPFNEGEEKNGLITVVRIKANSPAVFNEKLPGIFSAYHEKEKFDIAECPEIHHHGTFLLNGSYKIPLTIRLHASNFLVESYKKKYTSFFAKLRFSIGAWRRGNFSKGWGYYDKEKDPEYHIAGKAGFITAPSEAMKSYAVDLWSLPPEKIRVIPNPFRAPSALVNAENKTCKNEVLFFGRLNVLKGLVNLTHAAKKFLNENDDWSVRFIGDDGPGPYGKKSMRTWMKHQLKKYSDRVIFEDGMKQELLYDRINEAAFIVLPSLFEAFSYTCAEAMAAGKAVIGSREGGMKDLLENGKAGLLVDPMNTEEIFTAMNKLAGHDQLREQLGCKARQAVLSGKYDQEVFTQMENIYRLIITANAGIFHG